MHAPSEWYRSQFLYTHIVTIERTHCRTHRNHRMSTRPKYVNSYCTYSWLYLRHIIYIQFSYFVYLLLCATFIYTVLKYVKNEMEVELERKLIQYFTTTIFTFSLYAWQVKTWEIKESKSHKIPHSLFTHKLLHTLKHHQSQTQQHCWEWRYKCWTSARSVKVVLWWNANNNNSV